MSPASSAPRSLLIGILGLAVANLITGWLGMRLAIAPGYVTAIFPPAGIALACLYLHGPKLWPGALLGSFALNVLLGADSLADAPGQTLGIALGIAASSTLQALIGAKMLRHSLADETTLDEGGAILRFLKVVTVSSTVAPAVGTGILTALGKTTGPSLTWFTWWTGDTLGAVLFTPIAFCVLAKPREVWRPRLMTVAAPLGVALAVTVGLFMVVSKLDRNTARLAFERRADSLARELESELKRDGQAVLEVAALYAGSHKVDEDEFIAYADMLELDWDRVQAVGTSARVPAAERESFVEGERSSSQPDYTLKRWSGQGWVAQDSHWAEEYRPVRYIHPKAGNEPAIGIDLASHPTRRRALEIACDTGRPTATEWIHLAQAEGDETGVLILHPIYSTGPAPATVEERREALVGHASLVLRVSSLVNSVLGHAPDLAFSVVDESDPEAQPMRVQGGGVTGDSLSWTSSIEVGQRSWGLEFVSRRPDLGRSWLPWTLFAGGLLFCALVGAFLLFISGHTGQIRLEVERRTAELTRVNRELATSNKDLDGFAYVASHDLKAPLRAIRHLAEWIGEDAGDALDQESRKNLVTMRARVDRMNALLDDLLAYSRAGRTGEHHPETVRVGAVVDSVLTLLSPRAGLRVTLAGGHDLWVRTVRSPLELVLRNLIGNAIKHHDRDEGSIEVEVFGAPDGLIVEVRDDGPGIPAQHHERIFEMFTTLRPRDEVEGSGMGLAIVNRTIERQGGSLSMESGPGRGTTFRFFWPGTPAPTPVVPAQRPPVSPPASLSSKGVSA